ncbi:MAG: Mrp/NBP35 family ATP-binding protein, partial [Longimicrobiales bacterium]|nr:Mrp/NBP35 family ATP-binding protein [Longimicrobiales bacterium]
VVASGHVRNVSVDEGEVRFSFFLGPDDPGSLVKEARAAVEDLDGVESVRVNVQLPQSAGDRPRVPGSGGAGAPPQGAPRPGGAGGGPGPSGGQGSAPGAGGGLKPGSVPAPTPRPGILSGVDRVVAVSSGKGGVGKSMVAANLAAGLASKGYRVGLLDADVYGPNIPRMFGVSDRPRVTGSKGSERIEPLEAHGVRLMSLGFLLEEDQPAIMRGPLISGILKQFLEQVEWGELDYLIVDMPPGTGDAQLSLVQTIDVDGVVMVTTPQDMATGDVRRGVRMFERVNTRVLGIVENMSGYTCPHCGETEEIFGTGGGSALAEDLGLPLLGKVPLDPAVRTAGDRGTPTVTNAPDSGAGEALLELSGEVDRMLEPAPAG